ncbi:hypothetical protein SAY86_014359 [Trapa natans]|uniref:Uncharacterized protein n=1 Tax=Trapa natans TaxID=22666 RepID=A0AAN7KU26_TRANT|nr:hypothetical protein SAY86_014359 [Trapa natans]
MNTISTIEPRALFHYYCRNPTRLEPSASRGGFCDHLLLQHSIRRTQENLLKKKTVRTAEETETESTWSTRVDEQHRHPRLGALSVTLSSPPKSDILGVFPRNPLNSIRPICRRSRPEASPERPLFVSASFGPSNSWLQTPTALPSAASPRPSRHRSLRPTLRWSTWSGPTSGLSTDPTVRVRTGPGGQCRHLAVEGAHGDHRLGPPDERYYAGAAGASGDGADDVRRQLGREEITSGRWRAVIDTLQRRLALSEEHVDREARSWRPMGGLHRSVSGRQLQFILKWAYEIGSIQRYNMFNETVFFS